MWGLRLDPRAWRDIGVMETARQHRGPFSSRVYEPVRIEYQTRRQAVGSARRASTHNDWLTTKPTPPMLNISSGGSCRPYMDPRLVRRFALVYLAANEDAPIVLCIKDCPELPDFQLSESCSTLDDMGSWRSTTLRMSDWNSTQKSTIRSSLSPSGIDPLITKSPSRERNLPRTHQALQSTAYNDSGGAQDGGGIDVRL
ncbi:hypothetical protein C8R44DRAFT_732084 [Mycena epipterygia]|nr:hypothetical protein C8R44DRAFT_732084 [Mycena epipterygia]